MRVTKSDTNRLRELFNERPMPRSEPKLFGKWLGSVLEELHLGYGVLASKAEMSRLTIEAIINEPKKTSKQERRAAYEAALLLLEQKLERGDAPPVVVRDGEVSVYFTGHAGAHAGQCMGSIVDRIKDAQREIRVMAYVIYSKVFIASLVAAAKRGVSVRVIHDPKMGAANRNEQGIEWVPDHVNEKAHNKVLIVDDTVVFTGSFNFTDNADHLNAENLVEIRSAKLIQAYIKYWEDTRRHL